MLLRGLKNNKTLTSPTINLPTTAPNNPNPATKDVPMARNSLVKLSETKVIPAPNSPASPTPAMKR
ncbi:MAG: hypothetical protein ACO2YV_07455, partial [Pseudomonadales bacterium]